MFAVVKGSVESDTGTALGSLEDNNVDIVDLLDDVLWGAFDFF